MVQIIDMSPLLEESLAGAPVTWSESLQASVLCCPARDTTCVMGGT